jgi:methylisocitrate lyase
VDRAIERALAYVEAGADAIFAETANDLATYERFAKAIRAPVLANITEFGATPLVTVDQLRRNARGDDPLSAQRVSRNESSG